MARIHFLNVKEGDCSIIQHENGHVTMIDVCNASIPKVEDADATHVLEKAFAIEALKGNFNQKAHPTNPIEYLNGIGVGEIFRYIQTHPDMDHMDGLAAIDRTFKIINFWDVDNNKETDFSSAAASRYDVNDWTCYQRLRKSKDNPKALFLLDGAKGKYFSSDDKGVKSDDYLQILSPTQALIDAAQSSQKWNDSSYVVLYHIHGRKVLFCGDADKETIAHLVANHRSDISNIDVLIAPHHGRDSDKDFSFLDIMRPKITLFGNADSDDMAYQPWINKGLPKFTNNEVGNVMIEITATSFEIYGSYKSFVDKFRSKNKFSETLPHPSVPGMWLLWRIK